MKITLTDRLGIELMTAEGEDLVRLDINQAYGFEDILVLETRPNSFVLIDIDEHVKPSIVYTPSGKIIYQIPVAMKLKAYHPDAFQGDSHCITMTKVAPEVLESRRNLALNGMDLRWETGYYPHAQGNVVTRDEPWFEGKNAIDGWLERDGHGAWPYQSWGGGLRDDLEFELDFGREVIIDEVVIYFRADMENGHDINWESGTLEFSNGHSMALEMELTKKGQSFKFQPQRVTSIKLKDLKRELSAAFTALTQIEVFGVEGKSL